MSLEFILYAVLILAACFYSAVTMGLIIGIMRIQNVSSEETPFVSIIVAARDEEENLHRLLPELLQQTYPTCEIIVANDRSTDRTAEVIDSFRDRSANVKRIDIPSSTSDMPPKKRALAEAIKSSKGEILCFTDADCVPTKQWVSRLVARFTPEVGLVAGYSPYDRSLLSGEHGGFFRNLLYRFVAYEELKAAAWSAGAIGINKGWLCTGRNLAYRRAVYDEVGGFEKIKMSVSGDDDLFLQLVRRETAWKIQYAAHPESFVRTAPPESFQDFVEQRKRHFSAGKYFSLPMKIFFFLFHSSNVLLFIAFLGFLAGLSGSVLALPCFALKLMADVTLFLVASDTFRQRGFAAYFLLMEILYIFYNTFIGPLGFIKTFEWKPEPKAR